MALQVVVDRLVDSQLRVTSGLLLEQGCCQLEGEKSVGLVAVGLVAVAGGDDLHPGCRHRLQHVVRVVQGCAQQGWSSSILDIGSCPCFVLRYPRPKPRNLSTEN